MDVAPYADLLGELLNARPIRSVAGQNKVYIIVQVPDDVKGPHSLAEPFVRLDRPQSQQHTLLRRHTRQLDRFDGPSWDWHGRRHDGESCLGNTETAIALRFGCPQGNHSSSPYEQLAIHPAGPLCERQGGTDEQVCRPTAGQHDSAQRCSAPDMKYIWPHRSQQPPQRQKRQYIKGPPPTQHLDLDPLPVQ